MYYIQIAILCLFGILLTGCQNQMSSDSSANLEAAEESVEEASSGNVEDHAQDASTAAADDDAVEKNSTEIEKIVETDELPISFNLEIPFTSQAPHGNWNLPYQEACEEASMIMAAHYLLDLGEFTAESSNREILDLIEFETQNGYKIDLTASETVEVVNAYYEGDLTAKTMHDPAVDDIKKEIVAGNVVIMPFAGRELDSPFYTPPGPPYHMMVIRGFNEDGFITNDPGTRTKGENFLFSYDNIMSAFHDWNGGDVANGKKELVVVQKAQ